jgi:hypothetical protein
LDPFVAWTFLIRYNDLQELAAMASLLRSSPACGRNDEARDILAAVERESLLPELRIGSIARWAQLRQVSHKVRIRGN